MCGILNATTKRKLLTEEYLTFNCPVEIGIAVESATKDATELHGGVFMKIGMNELLNMQWRQEPDVCYGGGGGRGQRVSYHS